MKPLKNAVKDICALIANIGPIAFIAFDGINIVFKIIAGITFIYNTLYHYRTSNLERDFAELKQKYNQDVKHYEEWQKNDEEYLAFYKDKLEEAYIENEKLREEIDTYKKAGEL